MDDEAEAEARLGSIIGGRFRLEAVLGVGGMGAVYRATHVEIESEVAIKILLGRFAKSAEVKERFVAEGRIANKVKHPGAVKITDSAITDDGHPYLVMEYLSGSSLQRRWEEMGKRLGPREALDVAAKLLDVLAKAHEAGVVHRDIKPDNLFLTTGGELKVLDFGIARLQEAARAGPGKTRMGAPMGTVGFMAPEQAMGRWDEVDGRTDLWAVGALLFAIIGGVTIDEVTGSWLADAPPMRTRTPDVDARVAALIDKALSKDRASRFQTAAEMRAEVLALRAVVPDVQVSPPGDTRVEARPYGAEGAVTQAPPGRSSLPVTSPAPPPAAPAQPGAAFLPPPPAPRVAPKKKTPIFAIVSIGGVVVLGGMIAMIARGCRRDQETSAGAVPPPSASLTADPVQAPAPPPPPLPVVTAGPHADGKTCEGTKGQKYCGGKCVSLGEPATGCAGGTCTPCKLAHANAGCPKPGAHQACTVAACHPGFGNCNRADGDGCETPITTPENCGRCGLVCPAGANATAACTNGACAMTCAADFADCDKSPANGCETNLKASAANCGACGRVCPQVANAASSCRAGSCALTCTAGHADCNGNPADGCEVDVSTDAKSCGACGHACAAPKGGSVVCAAGQCKGACEGVLVYDPANNTCVVPAAPQPPPNPSAPATAPAPSTPASARKPRH